VVVELKYQLYFFSTTSMLHQKSKIINLKGSSLNFSAHGGWGKEKNLSAKKSVRPKVFGVPYNSKAVCGINYAKQAGKKEGGWGEGIFARPRFPPPPIFVFRFARCADKKRQNPMSNHLTMTP